jgi:hypothetical protein
MKFRSKVVEIEAMQLNHENLPKIWEWMGEAYTGHGENAGPLARGASRGA